MIIDFSAAGNRGEDREFVTVVDCLVAGGVLLVDGQMELVGGETRVISEQLFENVACLRVRRQVDLDAATAGNGGGGSEK